MAFKKSWMMMATALVSTAVACAAANPLQAIADEGFSVPPPVSKARAEYNKAHPAEWQKVLDGIPKVHNLTAPRVAPAGAPVPGTWTPVTHLPPSDQLSNPLLMTDGTVIVHKACSGSWYKLKPDANGSYVNGTWSTIASLQAGYTPLYFASQVLNNGTVVINGGEYDTGCSAVWSTKGSLYNPIGNTWTPVAPPSGWTSIGDAQSIILTNGKYMLANCCTVQSAIFNPSTLGWSPIGTGKADVNDEEGWALLRNGSVLTADAYVFTGTCGKNSEIFKPSTGVWSTAGNVTTQLSDCLAGGNLSYEVGPLVARPDATVVGFSGVTTGVAGTTIYRQATGTWSAGPNLPNIAGANYDLADAPAVALPSGNILFAANPGKFLSPVHFFEFTRTNTITQVADTPNAPGNTAYFVNFLMLPTGQVLQTDLSNDVEIYTPAGSASSAWKPTITACPTSLSNGTIYSLSGTQLSGVTHGVYGDDQQAATNFPIVRLTNKKTHKVYYGRTTGFSYRGIAPGRASTASFRLVSTPRGTYTLEVIANGIASAPLNVTVL